MTGLGGAVKKGLKVALIATFVTGVVSQNRELAVKVGLSVGLATMVLKAMASGDGAPEAEGF